MDIEPTREQCYALARNELLSEFMEAIKEHKASKERIKILISTIKGMTTILKLQFPDYVKLPED